MRHIYFVSYYSQSHGFGRFEAASNHPIDNIKDIEMIEEAVEREQKVTSPVVLYYSLLRTED